MEAIISGAKTCVVEAIVSSLWPSWNSRLVSVASYIHHYVLFLSSGNNMGDIGARMLAKALQLNTKLQTVKLDGNGITASGFTDLANALEK